MKYNILPDPDHVQKTIEAMQSRGIAVTLTETKESALAWLQAFIKER